MERKIHFPGGTARNKSLTLFKGMLFLTFILLASTAPAGASGEEKKIDGNAIPAYTVEFSGPVSDYGLDMDGDGLYDYLVFEFYARCDTQDTYRFTGNLLVNLTEPEINRDGSLGYCQVGHAENVTELNEAVKKITICFEGGHIYGSAQDGPFETTIRAGRGSWDPVSTLKYTTGKYDYEDFELPEMLLSGPVRSKARGLELARQKASEIGVKVGEVNDIDISSGQDGEIWIVGLKGEKGSREVFVVNGNSADDVEYHSEGEVMDPVLGGKKFLFAGSGAAMIFLLAAVFLSGKRL